MTLREIYELEGLERVRVIEDMSVDERDEICEQFSDCKLCPFALMYNSKPYCAEVSFVFRIKSLIQKGGKFRTFKEVRNEKKDLDNI